MTFHVWWGHKPLHHDSIYIIIYPYIYIYTIKEPCDTPQRATPKSCYPCKKNLKHSEKISNIQYNIKKQRKKTIHGFQNKFKKKHNITQEKNWINSTKEKMVKQVQRSKNKWKKKSKKKKSKNKATLKKLKQIIIIQQTIKIHFFNNICKTKTRKKTKRTF